jgi:hypothetical protein
MTVMVETPTALPRTVTVARTTFAALAFTDPERSDPLIVTVLPGVGRV